MVVLALILLLLVAVVVVSAVLAGDGTARLNLIGADIVTTERILFLAGVASTAVAGLALWMLVKGLKRAKKRRSEMHSLRDAAARGEAQDRQPGHTERRPDHAERPVNLDRGDRGPDYRGPDDGPQPRVNREARPSHPSTGPGRGVRSPTDPGEYRPRSRSDDDDHFQSLPRDEPPRH